MSSFFTNVLKLVSGSVIAQIIGILLIPVITRLYSPGDFGVFQLFLSISSILAIFSCLSYNFAIMLPKDDEDSANIFALCCILIIIISIISGSIFIYFSDPIGKILNAPGISQYLVFLPLVVFLTGFFSVLTTWTSRRKQYGLIATAQVANSLSGKTVQIGIGVYSASSPLGLIVGFIIGYSIALVVLFRQIKDDISLFKDVTVNGIKKLAIRYKRFPIYTSWSTLANTISLQLPSFMLIYFFNSSVLGLFSLANMILSMPMAVIGTATAQVFFQKASEEKNRSGSVTKLVSEVHKQLVAIGIFPMIILLIIADDLFGLVFGSTWYLAGIYAKILIPWIFLLFISSPLTSLFNVFEKQNFDLLFQLILLLSRIVTLFIGGILGDPILAILLYSITGAIFCCMINYFVLHWAQVSIKEDIISNLKILILAITISFPLLFAKLFLDVNVVILFAITVIVTIVYYMIILLRDPKLKSLILHRG